MTDKIGQEDYHRYHYLWHLIAIGVLTPKLPFEENSGICPEIIKTVWEEGTFYKGPDDKYREAKIALIDMGVAQFHPNLEPKAGGIDPQTSRVICNEALDLASHQYGASYKETPRKHIETQVQHLNIIDQTFIVGISGSLAERHVLESIRNSWGVERSIRAYEQSYATHGTACAGLACGTSFSDDQYGNEGNMASYYGVDPCSQILPITTSISPDPGQLIAAFLYAHARGVDAILFPRDAANPSGMPGHDELDKNELTRLDAPDTPKPSWALFEKVLKAVSMDIPVVCAAGNEGRSELIYPANLAEDTAATRNGIIAVGAVSYKAYRSGYSNYGPGLTVVAPSDDGEVYTRHQIRLDRKAASASDFCVKGVHLHDDISEVKYSAERLVTLDTPGSRGYAAGSFKSPTDSREKAIDDPGGLYTGFGGTSGASAIVAGVIALMQRQQADGLSGPEIKNKLLAMGTASTPNVITPYWYWLEYVPKELQRDNANGDTPEPTNTKLFGQAGLIDARALLGIS